MVPVIIFCAFVSLGEVLGECPSAEDLIDQRTVPNIRQVGSDEALVEWANLWDEMEWQECVDSAVVIVNGNEVHIQPFHFFLSFGF